MAKRSFSRAGVKARPVTFFIVAGIILLGLVICILGARIPLPGQNDLLNLYSMNQIRFGIDIRGGVEAIFAPKDFSETVEDADLESARSIIELRMDNLQILDREVTIDKTNDRIIVRFPWQSSETEFDPAKAIQELGAMAKLTFRDPDGNVIFDGQHVTKSVAMFDSSTGDPIIDLELDAEAAELFKKATEEFIYQRISIYMDETMISSPIVQNVITNGKAVISNIGEATEALALAEKINAGALPFALESISSNSISPTMGKDALRVMLSAGLAAFALICLFMLLYYRLPGFVACLSLLAQVVGILLAISIPQQTLTLQGIAGIILSIGMGVDANVIIAERIKEELKSGCSLQMALTNGFTRAFSSVLDGNITVAIAAIVLLIFGSSSMLSFGYSLLVGVILNGLTGVTASRLMIGSLSQYRRLKATWLYGAKGVKANV